MIPFLEVLHGSDFLLTSWLVGDFFFHYWIARPAGYPEREKTLEKSSTRFKLLLTLLLVVSVLWLLNVTFEMAESLSPTDVWMVITHTGFGHIWCLKLSLILVLLFFSNTTFFPKAGWLVFLLPLTLSLSGHAGADPSHLFLNLTLDYIHLVSISIWTGGLFSLYFFLRNYRAHSNYEKGTSHSVVSNFSKFAMLSTFLIAVTGVWTSIRYGLTLMSVFQTNYGKLVFSKIILFIMILSIAAVNHFIHLKRWRLEQETQFIQNIQRAVGFELILIVLVFGVAGFLTQQALPIH